MAWAMLVVPCCMTRTVFCFLMTLTAVRVSVCVAMVAVLLVLVLVLSHDVAEIMVGMQGKILSMSLVSMTTP
eukprot:14369449-Ditylum_brightwellii.AAC.1